MTETLAAGRVQYPGCADHVSALTGDHANQSRHHALKAELDPERLMSIARQQTGLEDFGDARFIEPYRMLLECVRRDVDFSRQGLDTFRQHIIRCLINRLRIHRDFTRHPEILEEDVSDPVVIIGMPRTGTTKMQRILSSLPDSDVQRTCLWQMLFPAPFANANVAERDPRVAATLGTGITSDGRPELEAAHLIASEEPEEDGLLCDSTFDDWVWSSVFAPSESYYQWVIRRPHLHNYRHLHRMYQYLQWQNGGRRNRIWITKNVQHIAYLEELLTVFPKATLVHCHRSPLESIPSLAKLSLEMWSTILRQVDPVFVGKAVFQWWRNAMSRYLETRERLGLDGRILDLRYEDIRRDGVGEACKVLQSMEWEPSDHQLRCMRRWESDNEQYKNGRHTYCLETFGLNHAAIEYGFGEYMQCFID